MYRQKLTTKLWVVGFIALLFPIAVSAQITFERTYGGNDDDWGNFLQNTPDGGYIIVGVTYSYGAGLGDVWLLKTNPLGDTVWTKTYGGTDDDYGEFIQSTSDGGFIIVGETWSFGAGGADIYLIKTDSLGDTVWTKTYGGNADEWSYSLKSTSDSGYIIAGATQSYGAGGYDLYLIKTDSLGDTLWTKTYGGSNNDYGWSIQNTPDGGYIIVGETNSYGAGNYDVYLIKTDSLGDTIWTKTYGGNDTDKGHFIQCTSDGYIIVGETFSYAAIYSDVYLIKIDSLGDTLWTKTYGSSTEWDAGFCVRNTLDGGFIIIGVYGVSPPDYDVYLIKTDSLGNALWTKTYGGSGDEWGWCIQNTPDGGYIIVGGTDSYGAGYYDIYLIKTDSLGNVGIEEKEKSTVQSVKLKLEIYPNPFSKLTKISLNITHETNGRVCLKIYDISGRLVKSFENLTRDYLSVNRVVWNGTDNTGKVLPQGVYLCRIEMEGTSNTEKVVKID